MKLFGFSLIAAMATMEQASADLNIDPGTCTLACGSSSNGCRGRSIPADVEELHPVRCCADKEIEGWMKRARCDDVWSQTIFDGVCHGPVNFVEAVTICAKAGGRICSKDELLNDCTRGSGCRSLGPKGNAQMVWTSNTWEPCTTDAECEDGLACTTNTCGGDGICVVEKLPDCLKVTTCGKSTAKKCATKNYEADPEFHFHHVRCCSDSALPGFVKNPGCSVWGGSEVGPVGEECLKLKSYDEAMAGCAAVGARLCTAAELEADCTEDTGCEFDSKIVWSSTNKVGK